MRALSIRQPYAELILLGKKRVEYRSRATTIRGRFYIYASLTPGPLKLFKKTGKSPEQLPRGVIVGSVELVDCTHKSLRLYEWHLRKPQRLTRTLRPRSHAQPVWFNPF